MRNNKLSRKRALKHAEFVKQQDGTEVLKTKESRAKVRRWTFLADVAMVIPAAKKEGEESTPEPTVLPMRTLKLDSVSYSTAREVQQDCVQHELYLRSTNPMFANAILKVRAIPHETVSNTTIRQLSGYRDMSAILDKALGMAIEEAENVVLGRSLGPQFVQMAATEAFGDIPAKPAVTIASIKEDFYKRALDFLKKQSNEQADSVLVEGQSTEEVTEVGEEHKPFVPEIVEIQKAAQ